MTTKIAVVLMWVGLGLAFLCSVLAMFFDVATYGVAVGILILLVGFSLALIVGGAETRH